MLCKYPIVNRKISDDAVHSCGQCMPCRINYQRVWGHRMVLEAELHEHNSFLTLTYDDDHLPSEFSNPDTGQVYARNSVCPRHHVLFMKSLREAASRKFGIKEVRFYAVGEYGENTQRPHFHYALFGYPSCPYRSQNGSSQRFRPCRCPTCQLVSDAWGKGNILCADLTIDSANYIAGYLTKRMTRDDTEYQQNILQGRHPEFARQSRMPGLAREYVSLIKSHLTDYDFKSHTDLPTSLQHGQKLLPLGRYMSDKLHGDMGFVFEAGDKLKLFEKTMRLMLLHNPNTSRSVQTAACSSMAVAMKLLNEQQVINLEAKLKHFGKAKLI